MRKFINSLPGLGVKNANDRGNYIPIAASDKITYPGSDYYEIALKRYTQQLYKDFPPTQLQGYVQLNKGTDNNGKNTIAPPGKLYYLGPMIVAQRDRPVRVKFVNMLPTGSGGNLFLPVGPNTNQQSARLIWIHDHAVGITRLGVYSNQSPGDDSGASAMGRWDYGPWFWPPYTGLTHGPDLPEPRCVILYEQRLAEDHEARAGAVEPECAEPSDHLHRWFPGGGG